MKYQRINHQMLACFCNLIKLSCFAILSLILSRSLEVMISPFAFMRDLPYIVSILKFTCAARYNYATVEIYVSLGTKLEYENTRHHKQQRPCFIGPCDLQSGFLISLLYGFPNQSKHKLQFAENSAATLLT